MRKGIACFVLLLFITASLRAQNLYTVIGNGDPGTSGDGGPAINAQIEPGSLAIDKSGNTYITDPYFLRKVDAQTGIISTMAGTRVYGFSGDGGPADSAQYFGIFAVAPDNQGKLYLVDNGNSRIRKIDMNTGIVTTVAGNGTKVYAGDSVQATATGFTYLNDIAVDKQGNIYINENQAHAIRKIEVSTGIVTTVAGTGTKGFSGDNGLARSALLSTPVSLCIDSNDNLYINDRGNCRIRKVTAATGIITTIAGYEAVAGYDGDGGPATQAHLKDAGTIRVDNAGNVWIMEGYVNVIRKIDAATGIINTVAGGGPLGTPFKEGARATDVDLGSFRSIALDADDNLYITGRGAVLRLFENSYGGNVFARLKTTGANCNRNGYIQATGMGGRPPYKFNWSTGDTTAEIYGLGGGNYAVTVSDSLGWQFSARLKVDSSCYSVVEGRVFVDRNENCEYDGDDQPVPNLCVQATSATTAYYGNTDDSGWYSIQIMDTGAMRVKYSQFAGKCYEYGNCPAMGSFHINAKGDSISNINIAIGDISKYDLTVEASWTVANPGFGTEYSLMPYNISPMPPSGPVTMVLSYDTNLIYEGAPAPQPVADPSAHTLTWTLDGAAIPYGHASWDSLRLTGYFKLPPGISRGYRIQNTVSISPTATDCDTMNNVVPFTQRIIGSFDPNEKNVSPAGEISTDGPVLTYTIHFQNTGTDSTHFVILKDTLPSGLEPASVVNIASSTKYADFTISGEGILTWVFDPLYLPDSATNPAGSQGFVTFSVHAKAGLQAGTDIKNTASIYFDYNEPIKTNATSSVVAAPALVNTVQSEILVNAHPNPFGDITHINISGIQGPYDFELYDVSGRLQLQLKNILRSNFDIPGGKLPQGIYLYHLVTTEGLSAFGKLVRQ